MQCGLQPNLGLAWREFTQGASEGKSSNVVSRLPELAGSTGSEAVAFYKLGEVPLLDAGGSHLVDDADGEDG